MSENIDYNKVNIYLKELKKYNVMANDEDLRAIIVDNYSYFLTVSKVYYEGLPLKLYCKLNDLEYSKVVRRYRVEKDLNPHLKSDMLLSSVIIHINKKKQAMLDLVKQKCELNCITEDLFFKTLYSLNYNTEDLTKEKINLIINKIKDSTINTQSVYFVNSITLKEHCEKEGIDYASISSSITILKRNFTYLTKDELVDYALSNSKPRKRQQETYKILENLNDYAVNNSYDVVVLIKVIEYLLINGYRTDQLLRGIEKNYSSIENIENIEIFRDLSSINLNLELKTICLLHKINVKDIEKLTRVKYSNESALKILYYFGEKSQGYNYTASKDLLTKIVKKPLEILDFEKDDLVYQTYALYKCNLINQDELFELVYTLLFSDTLFDKTDIYNAVTMFINEKYINDYNLFNKLFVQYVELNCIKNECNASISNIQKK